MNPPSLPSLSDLPAAEALGLEKLCLGFEEAWKAGEERPTWEELLAGVDGPSRSVLLCELLRLDLAYRLRRGERPAAADYLPCLPGHEPLIAAVLAAAGLSDQGRTGEPPTVGDVTVATSPPGSGGETSEQSRPTAVGPSIPGYAVARELGRGGMGVVYRGRDATLKREVAVKVLREDCRQPDLTRRFVEEAQVASQLQHPAIPPVHALGLLPDGRPYFAMKLVQGRTLAALLAGRPSPAHDLSDYLRVFEEVCQALAYAHSKGVIHRDLKPSNVMVGAFGEVQVMDWGLAKTLQIADGRLQNEETEAAERLASSDNLPSAICNLQSEQTQAGTVMGTLAYMAPEQACGEVERVDRRSDVFGLGALLCEILTGEPPYSGLPREVHAAAQEGQLGPALARLQACGADAELVELARACLRTDPDDRPSDAEAVARAVAAYRTNVQARLLQSELARATAAAEAREEKARVQAAAERRGRRLALALVATLAVGVAATLYYYFEARTQAGQAEQLAGREAEARQRAEFQQAETERLKKQVDWLAYVGQIGRAQAEWPQGSVQVARELLGGCDPELRGWEHRYLTALVHGNQRTLRGHSDFVLGVCFSPDGTRLASASGDGTVKVWDAATGREVFALQGRARGICFSPDGTRLAGVSSDHVVKVWDAQRGQELLGLPEHSNQVFGFCFHLDGMRLASAGADRTVDVWDAERGRKIVTLQGHTQLVSRVSFSPDGNRLASVSRDGTIKVWDVEKGQEASTLKGHRGNVRSVCFSPDGKRLATSAGADETVRLWDAERGQELAVLQGHTNIVFSVCFSPDGKRLASASADKTVKLWDADTGQELLTFQGHTDAVTSVSFSPGGKRLASASRDRTVKVWDVERGQETPTFPGHTGYVWEACFDPTGRRLASASADGTVKVWDVPRGQAVLTLQGHAGRVWSVCFRPDGKCLASAGDDKTVKVWDAEKGQMTLTLQGHADGIRSVCYSPDGKRLASASADHTVKVWDAERGQELLTLTGHTGPVHGVCFSPDGKRLASAGKDGTVKVWDAEQGRTVFTLKGHAISVWAVCFSPDGMHLASASGDRTVKLWDAETGQEVLTLKGHASPVMSVCFSPDGRRLASASVDRTVKVWDAGHGQEALTLKGHTDVVTSVRFSPDGLRLASASADRTVKVWDAGGDQEALTLKGQAKARGPS